jgi:Flp pilus assembly protein TadG
MMKQFLRNNAGSTLVELALTAPLLMVIIIASAELGRIAYYAIEVQSAARAGAAYGAQNVAFAFGSPSTIEQAAENDVPNITDMTFPTAPTTACVCETITNSTDTPSYTPSTGPISCSSNGVLNSDFTVASCGTTNSTESQQVIEYVQVSTQAIVKPMFKYPGLPSSFTLSGYSTMRVLQN